jgi:pimeloyl-ACP methyl ester carboxylesterase
LGIQVSVALAYGDHDWSNQEEREANRCGIPRARVTTIEQCGHFACLEKPVEVAAIIRQAETTRRDDIQDIDG